MVVGYVTAAQAASPQAYFEASNVGGVGNNVSMVLVPVLTSTGKIIYKDVQLSFTVTAAGGLSLKPGSVTVTDSATMVTGKFVAGTYKNGSATYQLSQPGINAGGRTMWSIVASNSAAYNFSANWTTGPIAGSPQQARLNGAHITYAGYSYGVFVDNGGFNGNLFGQNSLLGASGGPDTLTLFSYSTSGTSSAPVDHQTSTGAISLTRCKTNLC